ncbi:MAG: hypothetical protein IPK76_18840 [Lewinellaceae bacterium]|nr:hypothetical protein [Lewinellaceae bacterium]
MLAEQRMDLLVPGGGVCGSARPVFSWHQLFQLTIRSGIEGSGSWWAWTSCFTGCTGSTTARVFLAVHVTHHLRSSANLTVGFRSVGSFNPYRFIYFIPLALAGFKELDIVFIFPQPRFVGISRIPSMSANWATLNTSR